LAEDLLKIQELAHYGDCGFYFVRLALAGHPAYLPREIIPSDYSALILFDGFQLGEPDTEALVHDFVFFDALALPRSDGEADLEIGIVVQLEA
jgi:hypothetical protein